MRRSTSIILSESTAVGLFFMQRYRFLTIDQYARVTQKNPSTAKGQLLHMQRLGLLGFFGYVGMIGHGKTPKVYFLTRKGFDLLINETDLPEELFGSFKEVRVESAWSPQMYHRLRMVDLLISLEVAVQKRLHLTIINTFLEYRRIKKGNKIIHETTDYVDTQETTDNKIIPDAAFILENMQTGKRALFFFEMDLSTERINSLLQRNHKATLHHKYSQYDRASITGSATLYPRYLGNR